MSENLTAINKAIRERFGAQEYAFLGEVSLIVKPEQIVEVCKALRDEFNFEVLTDETAVDYWPEQSPRFHLVYRVRSLQHNLILGLRVPLEGNTPSIPTIEGIYNNANWFERELWDMFGIHVEGHSDLRRIVYRTIGKVTHCVRIIHWATKRFNSHSILMKLTFANRTPKNKAEKKRAPY